MIEALHAALGRPPDVVWRAPGRVNLIGEHTDYNDGFVLPFAIDRALTVGAARRTDGELRFTSVNRDPADRSWLAYPEGVARLLREEGVPVPGADVAIASDLPEGAGLSSSAALEVGVALALLELADEHMDAVDVALLCRRAEEEVVGVPCGVMDQLVVALGQADHALLIDTRSLELEPIRLGLADSGFAVLVLDTTMEHALRTSGYGDRRRECEAAARALGVPSLREVGPEGAADAGLAEALARRVRHVVAENERVLEVAELLRQGRVAETGSALTASHASLRDDYEVSTPELDTAVDAALAAGALGARLTGAGFGGSAIALCRAEDTEAVEAAVLARFEEAGFAPLRIYPVSASEGASRSARDRA